MKWNYYYYIYRGGYEILAHFNDLFEFDIKYCELNDVYHDERNFNIMICRVYNDLQQKWKSGETQKQRAEAEEARNKKMRKKGAEEYRKEQEEVEYVSDSETESDVERRKQEHEKFLKDLMNDKIALHTNFRVSSSIPVTKPKLKPKPETKPKAKYENINFDSDSD